MYLNVRLKIGFLLLITFILGQIAWKMTVQLLSTRVNFKTTITKQLKKTDFECNKSYKLK